MLASLLQEPRLNLFLHPDCELDPAQERELEQMIRRRASREPLQYILGTACFCGLEIQVEPGVLIPRPETEQLAELAWELCRERMRSHPGPWAVLDYGTGSGCLALAIASQFPAVTLHAMDVSSKALEIARRNAHRLNLSERIHFIQGSSFDALMPDLEFDLIVSNPPYIPSAQIPTLQPEVKDHEPQLALDGGADGLIFYRMFARQACRHLKPQGHLCFEFGDDQAEGIAALFASPHWKHCTLHQDLQNRPRFFTVEKKEESVHSDG